MERSEVLRVLLVATPAWAVLASTAAVYLYAEHHKATRACAGLKGKVAMVGICIDYGNGTRVWYNDTVLPSGSTVLAALVARCRVEYEYGKYGAYVKSINGVGERIISRG